MTITELILQSLSFFLYMICNTPPPQKKNIQIVEDLLLFMYMYIQAYK